ncbi:MAG: NfeD family protein [Spirochaetales bacterium]|nr:NfeD family protein [Spirochaetales bacterium]
MLNSTTFWLIIGIILLLSEFLIPGFTIFFFGVGAIITSLLLFFIDPLANIFWLQILIFLLVSISSLIFLRKKFTNTLKGDIYKDRTDYIGDECKVIEKVTETTPGRISYMGTTWNAYAAKGTIGKNKKAIIIGKKVNDSMVFIIKNFEE